MTHTLRLGADHPSSSVRIFGLVSPAVASAYRAAHSVVRCVGRHGKRQLFTKLFSSMT